MIIDLLARNWEMQNESTCVERVDMFSLAHVAVNDGGNVKLYRSQRTYEEFYKVHKGVALLSWYEIFMRYNDEFDLVGSINGELHE